MSSSLGLSARCAHVQSGLPGVVKPLLPGLRGAHGGPLAPSARCREAKAAQQTLLRGPRGACGQRAGSKQARGGNSLPAPTHWRVNSGNNYSPNSSGAPSPRSPLVGEKGTS